jgi:predicted RNase H-like HicB family nuclease
MKIDRYAINLIWSSEDQAYLAQIPDLPGCIADGTTVEQAIRNLDVIAQEWIETAKELGRSIPKPVDLSTYLERERESEERQQAAFAQAVRHAVSDILAETAKSRAQERTSQFSLPSLEPSRRK